LVNNHLTYDHPFLCSVKNPPQVSDLTFESDDAGRRRLQYNPEATTVAVTVAGWVSITRGF
jgi:phage-related baseplate assembly protein